MSRHSDRDLDEPVLQWLEMRHSAVKSAREFKSEAGVLTGIDDETRRDLEHAEACLQVLESVRRERLGQPSEINARFTDQDGYEQLPRSIGRFEIRRELGRGGAGVVFLAHDPRLRRSLALKVPRPEALVFPEHRERFLREAQASAAINHPNVVSIYEVGEAGPLCYIASAYVEGESLAAHLKQRGGRILPRDAAQLMLALARGVDYAHGRGILHRDIKPGNVLLENSGDDVDTPTPRLSDFGLAKLLEADDDITRTGALLGTPAYMAPEQAEGRVADVDVRTDVYGLGAVLYELLTGRPPLVGESDADTLRRIVSQEPMWPRRHDASVPVDLEAICLKCLEKSPVERYASAAALSDDLERFLADQPILAKRPNPLGRAVKWSRRHSDLAWGAVAMLLLAVAGTLVASVLLVQSNREIDRQRALVSEQLDQTQQAQRVAETHQSALQQELYSLDMQAAFVEWTGGRYDRVAHLLAKYEPVVGKPDVRSFAWYLLDEYTRQPEPLVMAGHDGAVREIALHPDGKRLLSAGDDGTVRVWDSTAGIPLRTIKISDDPLNALALSPDGQQFATGYQTLELWNLDTGARIKTLSEHETTIEEVAFSPDGELITAGSRDSVVRLVNLTTGSIRTFDVVSANQSIAFTDDGRNVTAIVKQGDTHYVRSWNCKTGTITGNFTAPGATHASLFTPLKNNHFIVANRATGKIIFWSAERQLQLDDVQIVVDAVWDMAVSPDGSTLLAAGGTGNLRQWKLDPRWTNETVDHISMRGQHFLPAHEGRITSLAFLSDDQVATAGVDGLVKVWRFTEPRTWARSLGKRNHQATITPDLTGIVGWSTELALKQEVLESAEPLWQAACGAHSILRIACAADASRIAVVDDINRITVWNGLDGSFVEEFSHESNVHGMAISPEGRFVAATGVDGFTVVWNVETTKEVWRTKLDDWGTRVSFAPKGDMFVVGGRTSDVLVVDTNTWLVVHRLNAYSEVDCVAFDRTGGRLATAHRDRVIRIWDVASGALESTVASERTFFPICSLAFHPDGKTLVGGIDGRAVRIWDLPTSRELGRIMVLPNSEKWNADQLVFDHDGRSLLALFFDPSNRHRKLLRLDTEYQSARPQVSSK